MQISITQQAEDKIRATGARVTKQRVTVLEYLMKQSTSLSHYDIWEHFADDAFDKVTLYRVLDWLTENDLVHKVIGPNQAWRFSAGSGQHVHEHAHFQCTKCDTITCISDVSLPKKIPLPAGFTSQEVDLLIKGTCPDCKKTK